MMNTQEIINALTKDQIRTDLPELVVGNNVKVYSMSPSQELTQQDHLPREAGVTTLLAIHVSLSSGSPAWNWRDGKKVWPGYVRIRAAAT